MRSAGSCPLLPDTAGLLATAAGEINAHVNDQGLCALCPSPFPCPRAELAEFTLGLLTPAAGRWAGPQPVAIRTHAWVFPGTPPQVGKARSLLTAALADCPVADDAVLCLSELAGNSVRHSASGKPGGSFTVRAEVSDGDCVPRLAGRRGSGRRPGAWRRSWRRRRVRRGCYRRGLRSAPGNRATGPG
jgi:hypothetical protein